MVDLWTYPAYVSISDYGRRDEDFSLMVSSVSIDEGNKDIEQVPNLKGGRIVKQIPQKEIVISFEGYPTRIKSPEGLAEYFNYGHITTIAECDTVTGWGKSTDAVTETLNSTNFKHGSGSINLGKDGTSGTEFY